MTWPWVALILAPGLLAGLLGVTLWLRHTRKGK
jgi:hypothetical protein